MTPGVSWYAEGLRFSCTACGNCCTGPQGYVWLSPRDEAAVAEWMGLDPAAFRRRYVRLVGPHLCLVDKPGGDCIFLTEDRRCSIHPVKPRQCLTYPFWPRIVGTRKTWAEEGEGCPGMDAGPLWKAEEIDALSSQETPREFLCRTIERKRAGA